MCSVSGPVFVGGRSAFVFCVSFLRCLAKNTGSRCRAPRGDAVRSRAALARRGRDELRRFRVAPLDAASLEGQFSSASPALLGDVWPRVGDWKSQWSLSRPRTRALLGCRDSFTRWSDRLSGPFAL